MQKLPITLSQTSYEPQNVDYSLYHLVVNGFYTGVVTERA